METILKTILYFMLFLITTSCWEPASRITDEIEGTYEFEYKRGDYQQLKIYNDSSFVQEFYMDKKSFENKVPPFYTNKGKWSVEKQYKLEFYDWLEYCYLGNPDSILLHPKQVTMIGISWNKATRNHNGYITIFDQTGYYFDKVVDK